MPRSNAPADSSEQLLTTFGVTKVQGQLALVVQVSQGLRIVDTQYKPYDPASTSLEEILRRQAERIS